MENVELIITVIGVVAALIAGYYAIAGKLDRSEDRQRAEHSAVIGVASALRDEISSLAKENREQAKNTIQELSKMSAENRDQHQKFNDLLIATSTKLNEGSSGKT